VNLVKYTLQNKTKIPINTHWFHDRHTDWITQNPKILTVHRNIRSNSLYALIHEDLLHHTLAARHNTHRPARKTYQVSGRII
jgi:hypothetical protein